MHATKAWAVLRGLAKHIALVKFMENIQLHDRFGVVTIPAKTSEGVAIDLGVGPQGVLIYRQVCLMKCVVDVGPGSGSAETAVAVAGVVLVADGLVIKVCVCVWEVSVWFMRGLTRQYNLQKPMVKFAWNECDELFYEGKKFSFAVSYVHLLLSHHLIITHSHTYTHSPVCPHLVIHPMIAQSDRAAQRLQNPRSGALLLADGTVRATAEPVHATTRPVWL